MHGSQRLRSDDHAVTVAADAGSTVRPTVTPPLSVRLMPAALASGAARSAMATMLPPMSSNASVARLLGADQPAASPGDRIAARINARTGSGRPLPPEVRAEAESGFGQPLGGVRIHTDAEAAELATELGARAFTSGQDIFFNTGVYDPSTSDGYEVLAHELTHTLQQSAGPVAGRQFSPGLTVSDPGDRDEQVAVVAARRLTAARELSAPVTAPAMPGPAPRITGMAAEPVAVQQVAVQLEAVPREAVQRNEGQRDGDSGIGSLIPDWIMSGVQSAVAAIPGYTMLTQIIGTDPLTDRPVQVSHQDLVDTVLTYGPFGPSVGRLLSTVNVLDDVFAAVCDGLAAHNLTLARIGRDIESAWSELTVSGLIDGNVAMISRHVDAILGDAAAAIRALADRVIEIVRSVVADVAEPLLQTPEIQPIWNLARKVLHQDPLRGDEVNAPTEEIMADFLRVIGQEQRLAQMQQSGTLRQVADWLDTQWGTFRSIGTDLVALFRDAWNAIQPSNLPNLLDTLPGLAERAFALMRRILDFAETLLAAILARVKHALLDELSGYAHQTPGFHLLTVILEKNPFTDERVPRTAENLIRGFITLLPGGETMYDRLAESGVIGEAANQITGAMARLNITWDLMVSTFLGVWDTLSLDDLLAPVSAFDRVVDRFGEPIERIFAFIVEVVKAVITLILRLMNFPSDLMVSISNNVMAAIEDIKRDPVAFLVNMLQALKTGFAAFLDRIVTFLVQGLGAWLFRGLQQIGVTVPADLSLQSVLNLVLQVLGVSVDMLWRKLGQHVGEETAQMLRAGIDRVTGAWVFLQDVQQNGVSAIWRYVADKLGNLWEAILGMAQDWIMTEIVQNVTARLISMLDPTGVMAVIRSAQALFNAIQSAIEYMRDILTIINEYVTTFAQVAAGNIGPGAEKIKIGLAHAIPVAIGFLANQVGIGNIPEKIVEIIGRIRELIDQALDWLFEQAMRLGAAALTALRGGDRGGGEPTGDVTIDDTTNSVSGGPDTRSQEELMAALTAAATEAEQIVAINPTPAVWPAALATIKGRYRITTLEVVTEASVPQGQRVHIHATVNPTYDGTGKIISNAPEGPTVVIVMNLAMPHGRFNFERVLLPASQVGLPPKWVRAHLVGQGFGQESPLGIFYAPSELNGHIQNDHIEEIIRGIYADRLPGTQFELTATARPHDTPPTPRLAYVKYELIGKMAGAPGFWLDLFEVEVSVSDSIIPAPQIRVAGIKIHNENIPSLTNYENAGAGVERP